MGGATFNSWCSSFFPRIAHPAVLDFPYITHSPSLFSCFSALPRTRLRHHPWFSDVQYVQNGPGTFGGRPASFTVLLLGFSCCWPALIVPPLVGRTIRPARKPFAGANQLATGSASAAARPSPPPFSPAFALDNQTGPSSGSRPARARLKTPSTSGSPSGAPHTGLWIWGGRGKSQATGSYGGIYIPTCHRF